MGSGAWNTPIRRRVHRSFLGMLPADVAERVTADGDLVDYPVGTTFYREGDPARDARRLRPDRRLPVPSEGRQVTVRYARSGEVLGIPLVVGGPLDVGAQTLAPSSLLT